MAHIRPIEVNPDEMAVYYVNRLFDQMENSKELRDLLGKEYFANHKKALAKKFGKPAEDIRAKDWQLLGSNDGNSWVVLDSRSGQVFEGRNQTKIFKTGNTTAYTYYKRVVLATNGCGFSGGGRVMQNQMSAML